MPNSQIGSLALLGAMIAGGLVLKVSPDSAYSMTSLTGVVLLLILFAYDGDGYRSGSQSVAFAAVSGFALMLASTAVLAYFPSAGGELMRALVWIGGAFLFTIIDRARMGGRLQPLPPATSFSSIAASPSPVTPEPAAPAEPPPSPEPTAYTAKPTRPPKEVTIYVGLVGEGLSVMRPVQAQDLGRNYYLIVETMPEGETWEYTTGQVVRCQKKNLSTGKGLVAVEEAPRA
jgi:hypothetical protein